MKLSKAELLNAQPIKRIVVVVGDSLLHGIETEICWDYPQTCEVCSLPGGWIRHVREELPLFIKPMDAYIFLLIHVGTNDTGKRNYEEITSDFKVAGRKLKRFWGPSCPSYQFSGEE